MDAEACKQLELLSERALRRASEEVQQQIRQLYADHGARGILGSGATIKAGVRLMGEVGSDELAKLLEDSAAVSRSSEAFDLVGETMAKLLDSFSNRLPGLIDKATRMRPTDSVSHATAELFQKMRSDLEADLAIARYSYLQGAEENPTLPKISSQKKQNIGGKPLAEHWDSMWAAIAVQLWLGTLRPKTQADVKAAMFSWFNANEIEIGDTAVTQRARQLWQAMQDAD